MTQGADFQHTGPVTSYPIHRVVCVIDSLQEAKQAVHALQDAGCSAEDIHLIGSQDFIAGVREWKQRKNRLSQVVEIFLASYDEGFPGETYLHEAEQGHAILSVRLPSSEQVNQVRDILVNSHAHQIKYFGRWAIADLPSYKGDWCFPQGAGERKRQRDALEHDFFSLLSVFASVYDGDEAHRALDRNTAMVGLLQPTLIFPGDWLSRDCLF